MVGTTISHYKVIEKIGQGGMGEVYRATDTKLNRDVVLKILPEQVEREARLVTSLHAPILIPLLIGTLWWAGCSNQPVPDSGEPAWVAWADAASSPQDWVDTDYRFDNIDPAYQGDSGPNVCVDEAHFNYHTAEGIYKPFAELLRGDGYRVTRFRSGFTADALTDCEILLIANAQAEANTRGFGSPRSNSAYPHASAFVREEIDEIILWVRGGGALFLIADHAPWPAAVSDLALLLGVVMLDGDTYSSKEARPNGMVVFGAALEEGWRELIRLHEQPFEFFDPVLTDRGTLAPHPVIEGRSSEERIGSVVTFSGQAFYGSEEWEPILVFGPNAVSRVPLRENLRDAARSEEPLLSVAGWLQGGTRKLDQGRVGILGEAAMCTAQLEGTVPDGMNAPQASQNAQFCLNVMHWLSGLLDE
jgi:hypothetical protein